MHQVLQKHISFDHHTSPCYDPGELQVPMKPLRPGEPVYRKLRACHLGSLGKNEFSSVCHSKCTLYIYIIYIYIWFVSWHLRLAGGIGSGGSTVKHACEIGEVLGSDAGQHKSFQTGRAKKCFGWKFSMSCSKEIFKAFLGSDKCSQFWFAYNVCFNITILRVLVTSVQA